MSRSENDFAKLKICLVGPLPPPINGMSGQWQQLLECLRLEGAEPLVADSYPKLPAVAGRNLVLRFVAFTAQGVVPVASAEVIHIQARSDWGFWGPVCWPTLVGKLLGKRVVVTFQGGDGLRFLRQWGRLALPFLRMVDVVIVASEYLCQVLAQFDIQAIIIPNIISLEHFEYHEPAELRPWLVVARHLHPIYNIPCVLRAYQIIQSRFPDAQLFLTGTGPQEVELRQMTADLGLHNVTFTGWVPDIRNIYRRAHIFVNASNIDNSPVAIVEALASGLPVVSTRVGDVPYMIEHGISGWLVDLDDHVGLAEGVTWLVEHPSAVSAIRQRANRIAQRYSWAVQRERVLAVYAGQPVPPEPEYL